MTSAPNATLTIGVQEDYSRLAFRFEAPTTVAAAMTSNRLELRFSRAADLDISELRANLPRFVREVRRLSAPGAQVRLLLMLDAGVRQRNFVDGNRVVIDLLPPEGGVLPGAEAANGEAAPVPGRPPVSGTARVQLVEEANDTRITVTWPAPTRAAAFRRGEAVWVVFDAAGRIDLAGVARAGRRHQDVEVVQGEGVIGLRIPAPPDVLISATAEGNSWTFTLGPRNAAGQSAALVREVEPDGRARLLARFGREGVVRWINDPEIGDRIGVAMIGGPARGVDVRRATMEAAVLPAAHGAVIEPRADDVTASFNAGNLIVTRSGGLIAAAPASEVAASVNAAMLEEALSGDGGASLAPLLDLRQVRERIDDLSRRAAAEGVREGASVSARMELARFLLQNELAAEALGALRIVAINQGELVEIDPEFRLMRGAANLMMGRAGAAQADLVASSLADNPSAALWRGYAAFLRKEWGEARRELERGAGAMEEHPASWRARFQLALATSALELNDHAAAEAAARAAGGQASDQAMRLQARLIEARLAGVRGDPARALTMLDELSRGHDEEVAVRASVEAIRIRRASGVMRAVDAIEPLEALRFRWRGDSVELATVGILGEVYSELGRWRDALATMRVAADRFPTDPAARQLRADMSTLFERLFLDGDADRLEPIQALGLFYEFSDLTPVGPNGDRIVRLLAGRLVHVDLLEQAAQLLQHQVDERLDGVSKAQVAGDLAAIYLMDRKPDQALVALASSRQPNMSPLLLADRRILEARALLDLGRLDAAVELVERDRSEDAQRVRADSAWRARDWERAAVELRSLLAMRNRAQPLDASGRQAVLRAGVALTLAGNEESVRALYRDYAGDMANSEQADAFEVVASGVHADGAAIRDVARAVARTDLLDRFLQRLRTSMTAEAAARTPPPSAPATPAPPGPPAAPPPAAPPAQPTRPTPAAGA
jgi:tetratricopeptide (TPR) repeat protein